MADVPFPFSAWQGITQGARSENQNVAPLLRERGLAEVLANTLQNQGGQANEFLAGQMRQNPQAVKAMQLTQQRGLAGAEMQKNRAAAANYLAAAREADQNVAESRAIWGEPGTQGAGMDADLDMRLAYASGDSEKVAKAQKRQIYGDQWSETAIHGLREKTTKEFEPFEEVERLTKHVESLDPTEGVAVLELANTWQRQIDPATVRESDIELMEAASASGFDSVTAWIKGLVDSNNPLAGETGRKIKASLLDQLASKDDAMIAKAESLDSYVNDPDVGMTRQGRATAYPRAIRDRVRRARARREERLAGTVSDEDIKSAEAFLRASNQEVNEANVARVLVERDAARAPGAIPIDPRLARQPRQPRQATGPDLQSLLNLPGMGR